jgi:arylamine N-acetyltransferase
MSTASTAPLSAELTSNVLDYLGVEATAPNIAQLDALIAAYVRTVPWESASRIAKRARTANLADCPRWPDEFWSDALHNGLGGTCFESNYAFFSLLRTLGYDGYLTINDMGVTVGCHAAIILDIGGVRWLADVGLPLHVPLPIDPEQPTERPSLLQNYTVRPVGDHRYQVERAPHPRPICYTLIDQPVDDATYRAATTADYGEGGYFLDALVVNKIVDEQIWRFNSSETPARLETFRDGTRIDHPIQGNVAAAVADRFGMGREIVRAALNALQHGR